MLGPRRETVSDEMNDVALLQVKSSYLDKFTLLLCRIPPETDVYKKRGQGAGANDQPLQQSCKPALLSLCHLHCRQGLLLQKHQSIEIFLLS